MGVANFNSITPESSFIRTSSYFAITLAEDGESGCFEQSLSRFYQGE